MLVQISPKFLRPAFVTHCIILEPDPQTRRVLENALASLHWRVMHASSPVEVTSMLQGPWAVVLAIESGDPAALDLIREIRAVSPDIVVCALMDELSPHYDRQVEEAGANSIFAKPVSETEIVEALVAGFMRGRG